MTIQYSAPEKLEDDWRSGRETPPEEMVEELRNDIDLLKLRIDRGEPSLPVQGRVSDYKSWLAAATAMELSSEDTEVTVFAPQRTNRESAVMKLRLFGAELIEHPGRLDLCIWEPWRENVGHVDKATCESIGCPFYLGSDAAIADRTEEAVSGHLMMNGGEIDLDTDTMKRMGRSDRQDMCPAQLYLYARGMEQTAEAVNVATYAKAFADAAISDDDPLDSDVLLLDEAHTIAADPEVVVKEIEPASLLRDLETITDHLEGSAEQWARRARRELMDLRQSVEHWLDRSSDQHVDPNDIFAGDTMTLSDAFDTLDTVDDRVMQAIRRRIQRSDWESVNEAAAPYTCVESVRGFLSRIKQYRDGNADFVHTLYEERGEPVNEMAFRAVDESVSIDEGTTPGAVFEAWRDEGTHPAIADRWGPLLDRHIESLWDGRCLRTASDLPGAPMMPMDRLRDIAGATSVVTLSATHNELSDPTRPPEQMRPTRHDLLCAPVNLRSRGSDRSDYDGSDSVSPSTPWFRSLVERAKDGSGDALAAVPINYSNASKWESMPVERLDTESGTVHGIVPNSEGAIGEKGLESMDVDTVMCGVQVQSPAPTARRLMQWWEMLAPRTDDPSEVLATSWRLLAQHAVAGTIQAGGRFDWDATNFVFERPGLLELAGFECEMATPDSPGFAGEFVRLYEETDGEWTEAREAVRARKVIGYLRDADRKAPTPKQTIGEYARVYGGGEEQARVALRIAHGRDEIEAEETAKGIRFETT